MQTKIIDGAPRLANDKELTALVEADTDPWGGGGTPMDIVILGTNGRIDRTIRTDGMGEYIGLSAIGL